MIRPRCAAALVILAPMACATATTQDHMLEHFERSGELQSALIRGDVDTVRDAADWLAEHSESQVLPPWSETYLTDFRQQASQLTQAQDLQAAAAGTGGLLRACGACHQAAPDGPTLTVADQAPQGADAGTHMVRHAWAVDRMAGGLVGPAEDSWTQGLAALSEGPLENGELAVPPSHMEEAGDIASRLHRVARDAGDLTDWDERAEAFGQMTYQCATCHAHRAQ